MRAAAKTATCASSMRGRGASCAWFLTRAAWRPCVGARRASRWRARGRTACSASSPLRRAGSRSCPTAATSGPELKGSIGEEPNQTNYSDRNSVRILGIERKPRKTTSSKWHATQNTRRGHRKGKQTALRQRGGLRSRTNPKDAIVAFKGAMLAFTKL